jgi:hypothetical protein
MKQTGQSQSGRLNTPQPRDRSHPCPGSSGVEQWTENPRVGGSNPPPGTI